MGESAAGFRPTAHQQVRSYHRANLFDQALGVVESQGMLLAADTGEGPIVATFEAGASPPAEVE